VVTSIGGSRLDPTAAKGVRPKFDRELLVGDSCGPLRRLLELRSPKLATHARFRGRGNPAYPGTARCGEGGAVNAVR
jgi:hypothetical protein